MSTLLFKLNSVPEQEAEHIRSILNEHKLDYFETSAGKWGISMAAIWLKDEKQLQTARTLIAAYQKNLRLEAKQEYEQLKREGKLETFFGRLQNHPLQFVLYWALIILLAYISIMPFLDFAKQA